MKISIYRFNPDKDKKPYLKSYDIERTKTDMMLLDLLIKIKGTRRFNIDEDVLS